MNHPRLLLGIVFLIWSNSAVSQNNLPIGFHDTDSGLQRTSGCTAAGWAADPDNLSVDLAVRVLSDGLLVAETTAR